MSDYSTKNIDNTIINKYLFYKNLDINRIYSSSKKKIKKIDHFIWWFTKQKFRKSFLIFKNDVPIFISTSDHLRYKNKFIVYSGLISCKQETNLFDLLKAIKIQNIYLNKLKNRYCFISIDKKNVVLLKHWKYFGYMQIFKTNPFYKQVKKLLNIDRNFNIYYKKI